MLSVELLKHLPGFTLDVRWQAREGVVALFGPSGSGKTLTLHCMAGLVQPDSGHVSVGGRILYDSVRGVRQPIRDRRVGVVFQGYALFPHLTVAQNIAFGLDRLPAVARRTRTGELLERLRLNEVRRLKPRSLSAGQQQRVALGRALAQDPDLLLLDEPLSALDGPARRALRDDLAGMLRGFSTTAVLVTHDLAEACHLADQLVVYDRGQVLQAGVKAEVLSRPASVAVAQVLGIRNILEGELLEAGRGTVRLSWRGHELIAECEPGRGDLPRPGRRIAFYIPPEHVHLLRKDRPASEADRRINLIRGTITAETDLGAVVLLRFRVEGDGPDPPSGYDLEIEMARLVHEKLCVHYDRQWEATVQPGAVQLLPATQEGG